ncbi:tRNA (adenosine(37)-N6)-threonylcarbamoyltransferase complex transferase subunit TsaD [Ructibacterium gallinarum]|uniref:tRNA N6-adenosine threonylcarbamoyltransferase n=1 Tax=Ructibacterium gallinarum TaxID=2779355 RepID=A0A9D5M3X5_9FIRM|nr:tRNA (adenosine(37)-N6)-threonylcarbamoyltransferase complex transferase subunit TsaD [Ructibacterium gallinarum]MBE5041078.1 tRNA (adenosine(37)-N6)-threonylcarbamoyltransferase complex transferase subunit TsaD [Ructibacterium gallinarum]
MKILAIESSCDETAAAVVQDGTQILSNVIYTQIALHQQYGGVVPEIASRKHIENISAVIDRAVSESKTTLADMDAIAVTYGPGLVGALLVGVSTAKALAFALEKPLVPVHHIKGHICANYLENPDFKPPFLCLVASGGHSHIVLVKDYTDYQVLARTRDDAAGEAFDKVSRVLGLGYPGGPAIQKKAKEGNPNAIHFPRVNMGEHGFDFSFSGVKTAVINYLHNAEQKNLAINPADVAASFQEAVVDVLSEHLLCCAKEQGVSRIALAGGVAANQALRERISEKARANHMKFQYPRPELCTDNAAMIGCAAYFEYQNGVRADMSLNAVASVSLI